MDMLIQMGQRLSARRKQLGLSQESVAERTDLTTQTISTAVTGSKALRPENIVKICDVLGISTEYALRGSIAPEDITPLFVRMSELPPQQFRRLENIILNYIEAVTSQNHET